MGLGNSNMEILERSDEGSQSLDQTSVKLSDPTKGGEGYNFSEAAIARNYIVSLWMEMSSKLLQIPIIYRAGDT